MALKRLSTSNNVCDHQECYAEVGSQAISYTTGVPAMIGTKLVMDGTWKQPGVYNLEELDPDPFMEALINTVCHGLWLKIHKWWTNEVRTSTNTILCH